VAFDITRNAFARFGVSPRAPVSQIEDAFEDAVIDDPGAEAEFVKLKQSITTPKPRLDNELRWLVGMAPARAEELVRALVGADAERIVQAITEEAEGLAAANLAADACVRFKDERFLPLLITACQGIEEAEVLAHISGARAASGFPAVTAAHVRDGLKTVLAEHAGSAVALIASKPQPAKLMAEVVTRQTGPVVEAIAAAFAQWASPKLTALEARITAAARVLAQGGGDTLSDLIALLEEWDEFSQPLQLYSQAKGMDDPRSLALYREVRETSLELANKHNAHSDARRLTEALLRVFEELPSAKRQLTKDLTDLDGIEDDLQIARDMADLDRAMKGKDNKAVQAIATRMLAYATDPGLRTQLQQVHTAARQHESSKFKRLIGWGVAAAFVLFIAVAGMLEDGRSRGTGSYAPGDYGYDDYSDAAATADAAATDAAAAPGEAAAAAAEPLSSEELTLPGNEPAAPTTDFGTGPGTAPVLSETEIVACLAEAVRLEALEARINTNAAIDRFNDRVDRYNADCGQYQYRQADMARAENAIAILRPSLLAEADRLATEWAGE
jgi:hypothetical protein